MGYIIEKLKLKGNKGEKELNVMFDSGAKHSVINEKEAKEFCDITFLPTPKAFKKPNGEKIYATGACIFATELKGINNIKCNIEDTVYTIPNLRLPKTAEKDAHEMIIGNSTLQKFSIKLQFNPDEKKNRLDLSECKTQLTTI